MRVVCSWHSQVLPQALGHKLSFYIFIGFPLKREYGQIIDTQGLVVTSGSEGVWWRWLLEIFGPEVPAL